MSKKSKQTPILDLPAFQNMSEEERDKVLKALGVCNIKTVKDLEKVAAVFQKTMTNLKKTITAIEENLAKTSKPEK